MHLDLIVLLVNAFLAYSWVESDVLLITEDLPSGAPNEIFLVSQHPV